MNYPDKINGPNPLMSMNSGRSISQKGFFDGDANPEPNLLLDGDPRFHSIIDYANQIGLAVRSKDLSLLPKHEDPERMEELRSKALIAMNTTSKQIEEKNVGELVHREIISQRDGYDKTTRNALAYKTQELQKLAIEYKLITEEELLSKVEPAPQQSFDRLRKLSEADRSDFISRVGEISAKSNLMIARIAGEEELRDIRLRSEDDFNKFLDTLPPHKKKETEEYLLSITASKVENSSDLGKGGATNRGDVCRHIAPIYAAAMDSAGYPTYAVTCWSDMNAHVIAISATTGNPIETTERTESIYHFALEPGTFEKLISGKPLHYLSLNGTVWHINMAGAPSVEMLENNHQFERQFHQHFPDGSAIYNKLLETNKPAPVINEIIQKPEEHIKTSPVNLPIPAASQGSSVAPNQG